MVSIRGLSAGWIEIVQVTAGRRAKTFQRFEGILLHLGVRVLQGNRSEGRHRRNWIGAKVCELGQR
jgi:hypothetical protein